MTDPIRPVMFVQGLQEFSKRDDLNMRLPYWELDSQGDMHYVAANNSASPSLPGASGWERFFPPQYGSENDSLMSGTDTASYGTPGNGREIDAATKAAFRSYLVKKGLDGRGITNDNALTWAEAVNNVERGMIQNEDLDTELLRSLVAKDEAAGVDKATTVQRFASLYGGAQANGPSQRASRAIAKVVPEALSDGALAQSQAQQRTDADGNIITDNVAGQPGASDASNPAGTPGSTTKSAAATAAGAGIASDGAGKTGGTTGLGGTVGGLAPGVGPGGVQVTGQLLKDFIDSDFAFGFNRMINSFKDAGGAAMFMDFLSRQFTVFQGEYKGQIADQAASGQIPTLSFSDYLQKRTGAQVGTGNLSPGVANKLVGAGTPSTGAAAVGAGTTGAPIAPLPATAPPVAPSAGQGPGLTPNGIGDSLANLLGIN